MKEVPKRLLPTKETVRALYLKSGNNCAFPHCERRLITGEGDVVGEICHIEDALPGCRFNPKQTNAQRRHESNLVMLCHDHHVITSNEVKYPIASMMKLKTDHEAKFLDVAYKFLESVTDHTRSENATVPKNLTRMARTMRWKHDPDELAEMLDDVRDLLVRLRDLPKPTREFFEIVVRRSTPTTQSFSGPTLEARPEEIRQAVQMRAKQVRNYFGLLDSKGFICDNDKDDMGMQLAGVRSLPDSDWPFFSDLRIFCKREKLNLQQFIVDLDFSPLGDPE